ncbi:MAG: restriction endonuclease subunit S [Clostridia bacterium]|nr:restriction endonuclease subunit S [Clostridia bacterium]
MTPQELKNSILQLAIQGKLVAQRPEEGTAEELYRQIQQEKQALIKAGKIKKEKPLPEITENEIPFEIPENWKWVRWGEIINIVSARRVHQSDWQSSGVPFYRAREIAKLAEYDVVDNELFISEKLYEEYSKSGVPQAGDLMVTAVGTLGKAYIVKANDRFYYKDASVICLENYGHLSSEFLKYLMQSEMMMQQIRSNSSGTTVATLTMVRMVEYLFPLPPLAEQKRIVAKIEELLPYIDRYEKAWNRLEDFNKRFPADMQKSILQLAIQGKLTEQHPEEGTGEELYQQIQKEKQALIKAGKIKKEKPMPEITDDEIPFDIPERWRLVRLGEVISLLSGTDFKPEEYNDQCRGTPYITGASSLSENGVLLNRWTETPRIIAHKGDVLLVCKGSGYGKTVICDIEKAHIARQIMAIQYNQLLNMKYIMYFLNANLSLIKANGQGVIPGIDRGSIQTMVFPLPPLAEQKRIVAKLEELLPLCERLK